MNEQELKELAAKYELDAAFVSQLYDNLTDKATIEKALRMFVAGTLKFDIATGNAPINVASVRHDVAVNMWNTRKIRAERVKEQMEMQRRIVEYYNGCRRMTMAHAKDKRIQETVFIKDGIIVAFGHFEPNQGGIYAANNPVMPDFHWQPHDALARLRKMNRAFYRKIKKAATKSPREWFIFDEHTIRKDK